ncbi:cytochrome P450 [Streptomyces hirsutus]|uniref:cytochrome P450 n=1 Tax=Streptomyces hirsutus TaxID=35620 RepID=UPI00369C68E7
MAEECLYSHVDNAQESCGDYLRFSAEPAIYKDEVLNVWVVTGFREVTQLLNNPALSSAWPQRSTTVLHSGSGIGSYSARGDETVRRWFMFNDAEQHLKFRRMVAPLFTAEQVAVFRPYVEDLVAQLLERRDNHLDVITDVAIPLSSSVICRLLGLPDHVAQRLRKWSQDIAALLYADYLPDVVERGHASLRQLEGVIQEALRDPALPTDTGLSLVREAWRAGRLDESDILGVVSLLVYAGFETTSAFIGRAVRSVLHADMWAELSNSGNARLVEELFRFDTSVRQVARLATKDVPIAGHVIDENDLVLLMLGAANRDSSVFCDPHFLKTTRESKRHLAFGYGSHYCLGAGLARLEVQTVLKQLATKWPRVELAKAPVVKQRSGVPVLEHLIIRPKSTPSHLRLG